MVLFSRYSSVYKTLIFTVCLICGFSLYSDAQNKTDGDGKVHVKINGKEVDEETDTTGIKIDFNQEWKYFAGDNPAYATVNFDDKSWLKLEKGSTVELNKDSVTQELGNLMWFRTEIFVDSSEINKALGLYVKQNGSAAEVFIDGNSVAQFGKVGHDLKSEESKFNFIPKPVPCVFAKPGKHLLAVRVSAFHYRKIKINAHTFEFKINFTDFQQNLQSKIDKEANFPVIFLLTVYLTLGLVHLILFIFFRTDKQNLFFSIYCISISFFLCFAYIALKETDFEIFNFFKKTVAFIAPLVVVTLVALYHTIYYSRLLKVFWVLILLYALIILSSLFLWEDSGIFMGLLIAISIVEIFRTHIRSIIKKRDGALILGMGILYLPSSIILFVIIASIADSINSQIEIEKILAWILAYSITLSVPFSITIYLSRNFARVNRRLVFQVEEIKHLSEKSFKQESEKKKILEEQNVILETKVQQRTQELADKNELITLKNREITDNLNYAKRIQSALLPELPEIEKELGECFIYYQPKDIVSGDFYSYFKKENKILLAVVDCTGHGVSGAFMSMIGSGALNQIINVQSVLKPSEVLDNLNIEIISSLNQKSGDTNDGMDVAFCCIDKSKNTLEFSGANRPLWLIREGQIQIFKPDKLPIGGLQFENRLPYTNHEIKLKRNDTFYMFTDGFADQFGGPYGKKMMTKQLKEVLFSIQDFGMEAQQQHIRQFFEDWKGRNEQVDDVLVMGIRI